MTENQLNNITLPTKQAFFPEMMFNHCRCGLFFIRKTRRPKFSNG